MPFNSLILSDLLFNDKSLFSGTVLYRCLDFSIDLSFLEVFQLIYFFTFIYLILESIYILNSAISSYFFVWFFAFLGNGYAG